MQSAEKITNQYDAEFKQAVSSAQNADFQSAVVMCQEILKKDETYSPAYSLMAEIWKSMGNLASAEKFYGMAAKFDPNNSYYPLEQVKTIILQDRIQDAYQYLLHYIPKFPNEHAFHMLLADLHMRVMEFDKAVQHLQKAQQLGAENIYEHMAICYKAQGLIPKAEETLLNAAAQHPENVRFAAAVADLYTEQRQFDAAESYYLRALSLDANFYGALLGYGNLLMFRKDHERGLSYLQRASDVNPAHPRSYYLMGAYYFNHKHYEKAVAYMKQSLAYQPEYLAAQQMLATALFSLNRKEEALPFIDKVLVKFPDHPSFAHIRAMILGQQVDTAPASYVRDLFDCYADHFETHLVEGLKYIVPEVLEECFHAVRQERSDVRTWLSLLDLGCGTGLGAERFLNITQQRVGVDLSSAMIQKALAKSIYTDLQCREVVEYLQHAPHPFDFILATDVLVYMGKLEPFFQHAAAALKSDGYLAFSTEISTNTPGFEMMSSGRYGHNPEYVKALGAAAGLSLLCYKELVGRIENTEDLPHAIYIFHKA